MFEAVLKERGINRAFNKLAKMMLEKTLHILCFDDSLTAGFSLIGAKIYPYKIVMSSTLEKAFPTYQSTTDVQGLPGET